MLVSSSGFEDVIFQSNVCSTGSLNGVINGTLYNEAWNVHGICSEAMERITLKRYLVEVNSSFFSNDFVVNQKS